MVDDGTKTNVCVMVVGMDEAATIILETYNETGT